MRPSSFPGSSNRAHPWPGSQKVLAPQPARLVCCSGIGQLPREEAAASSPGTLHGIPSCPLWALPGDALGPSAPGPVALGGRDGRDSCSCSLGSHSGSRGCAGQEGWRKQNREVLSLWEETEAQCPVLFNPHPSTGGISLGSAGRAPAWLY